jgi:plasmid stabilization system protein ParE
MSLPIILTPEAEEDLKDAKTWYDKQRAGLSDDFLLCVEEAFDMIQQLPGAGLEVLPGVRRVLVRRFPYVVIYRAEVDQISILAVYHTRRDPRGWQTRV